MKNNQLTKFVVIGVVLLGAFGALKMGWISQSTFNQLLGNQSAQQEQPVEQPVAQPVERPASEPTPTPAPISVSASANVFVLPQDRNDICASKLTITGPQDKALYNFAKNLGLSYPETFVRVSNHINQTGRLPNCYMQKNQARNLGWSGGPLWGYADGRAIGGNRFGNREGNLPGNYNGKYIEADLDYDGRRRGADRLVFVRNSKGKWLQWVTVNHYGTFHRVPNGG